MSGDKSQEQNSSSTEFIERRRAALERYLNRIAVHPVLSIDPDFREFLEAGKLFYFLPNDLVKSFKKFFRSYVIY